jgi:hypothetical protein
MPPCAEKFPFLNEGHSVAYDGIWNQTSFHQQAFFFEQSDTRR